MNLKTVICFLAGVLSTVGSAGLAQYCLSTVPANAAGREGGEATPDTAEMLNEFVTDFRQDGMALPLTFGIEVRDATPSRWHVVVGQRDGDETPVQLHKGFPRDPVAYFTTDQETLAKLHGGQLASLTAMGKAFSTDFAPLDIEVMDGFQPDPEVMQSLISAAFHFWTRGFPERVRFGDLALTRRLHGSNGTLFYYQEGFRSGFFQIQPGDHVNADERSRTNPFPTMLVITRGNVSARIGDTECELHEGEAIFIGSGVHHELWIDKDREVGSEGIILMFGEGA